MSRPNIIFTLAHTSCTSSGLDVRSQSIACQGTSTNKLTQYLIQSSGLSDTMYTELYNNLNALSGRKLYRDLTTGQYYDSDTGANLQGVEATLNAVAQLGGISRMSTYSTTSVVSFFLNLQDIFISAQ